MHVFNDLFPYICTFGDCDHHLTKFPSRAAWADHEFNQHRFETLWTCPECPAEYDTIPAWELHLKKTHNRVFADSKHHIAQASARRKMPRPTETEECPLCRVVVGKPRRLFIKHVARHMEDIALMVLPRDTEDDSEEGSISTVHAEGEGILELVAGTVADDKSSHSIDGCDDQRSPMEGERGTFTDIAQCSHGHFLDECTDDQCRFHPAWLPRASSPPGYYDETSSDFLRDTHKESSCNSISAVVGANLEPNENWSTIADLEERGRIQNRIAQRNYRMYSPPYTLTISLNLPRQENKKAIGRSRERIYFFTNAR